MTKKLFCLFSLIIFSAHLSAQTPYDFLKLDASPRTAALAGAFVANTDDPNVLFYNPAGISQLDESPVSFSYLNHLSDISYASLSGSYALKGIGRFGAGIQYINYGDFTRRDNLGNDLGQFGAGDLALTIGYANKLDENFYYGVNVKFIYTSIEDQYSTAIASDWGLQYVIPEDGWSFGLSILNVGGQMSSYFDHEEKLPLDVRIGLYKELAHTPFKFYFSFHHLNENSNNFSDKFKNICAGSEIRISKVINFRFGYDNDKRKDWKIANSSGLAGVSLGVGINVNKYKVDYAFTSMGAIGALHRFGVSTTF